MASRPESAYRRKIPKDHLSCCICSEPYTRSKALPCQHSYCQECLENQQRVSTGRSLRCSVCRHLVTLPSEGVAGLPNNHDLANLCEELSKKNRCGFHPTKDVDLFCQQCEVPVCSECIGDGHPGHNVTGIKQVAEQIKANIRAQLNSGQQKMETFSAFLTKIEDVQKRLTDNKTQTQQEINKAFDEQFNTRIQAFTMDGVYIREFTTTLPGETGEKLKPHDVAVYLVSDINNHCVHVLDREGNFKFKFGSEGSDDSQLKKPQGICVGGMGNIIVADRGNDCVKMFDSQGRFLCYIGSGMKSPWAVAVSPGGDVVVTDYENTVSVWTQG
ncbi:tripartite motif-containing protein 2-like [Branchiostoma floridae]|uniref:RING-type E3 ubiquitin transferase n=1 Tax=Branchiostoma floridae TaxID=7739 RepID=A0A9J7HG51_BRAFL|nr:tripartite motif-containing protein 2-like [Branchiostoma floridae]